jgi:general secretion pathway protein G
MKRTAFTLIEMILVVVIIGLLASLVLPQFIGRGREAKIAAAQAQIDSFKIALNNFELDTGRFPTTTEGLQALVEKPASLGADSNWRPYLDEKKIPTDPWDNEYLYRQPGVENPHTYDLFSSGPDGKPNTDDDIGNTQ